jgi:hypothetical protein
MKPAATKNREDADPVSAREKRALSGFRVKKGR